VSGENTVREVFGDDIQSPHKKQIASVDFFSSHIKFLVNGGSGISSEFEKCA
jgi:hypothetical protein